MSRVLRLAIEADAESLLRIYAPVVRQTPISFEEMPPSLDEMRRRIRSHLQELPWLVCESGGVVLGYAYASRFRARIAYQWTVEVTVYVDPAHQGRGVARSLYLALFRCLRLLGYEVDPLTCNRCGAEMKLLAFITEPSVIRTILDHRDKTDAVPRAPPLHSSV